MRGGEGALVVADVGLDADVRLVNPLFPILSERPRNIIYRRFLSGQERHKVRPHPICRVCVARIPRVVLGEKDVFSVWRSSVPNAPDSWVESEEDASGFEDYFGVV